MHTRAFNIVMVLGLTLGVAASAWSEEHRVRRDSGESRHVEVADADKAEPPASSEDAQSPVTKPHQQADVHAWRGRRGPKNAKPVELTEKQEAELLAAIKKRRPEYYEELMRLKEETPQRYRWAIARVWRLHQRWQYLPQEAREAAATHHDLRVKAAQMIYQWQQAKDPEKKARLKKELHNVLAEQFDAQQTLREYQLVEFEKRIKHIRQELQARAKDRDKIIAERLEELLSQQAEGPKHKGSHVHKRAHDESPGKSAHEADDKDQPDQTEKTTEGADETKSER